MKKGKIRAWKVDSFMKGLQSVGFILSNLEMKHSDNYKRFAWYYNGILVAKYEENKQSGWFDENAKCRYGKGAVSYLYNMN